MSLMNGKRKLGHCTEPTLVASKAVLGPRGMRWNSSIMQPIDGKTFKVEGFSRDYPIKTDIFAHVDMQLIFMEG